MRTPGPEDDARHNKVGEKLFTDLDRYLVNYRTFDKRQLTEGEVMSAIGRLIANKSKTDTRVAEWANAVGVAAFALYNQMKDIRK